MLKSRPFLVAFWSLAISLSLMIVLLALRPNLTESVVALYRSFGQEQPEWDDRFVDVPSPATKKAVEPDPATESDRHPSKGQRSTDDNLYAETSVPQIKLEPIPAADVGPAVAADETAPEAANGKAALDSRLAALQQTVELLTRAEADRREKESERAGRRLEAMRQELRLRDLEEQLNRLKVRAAKARSVGTAPSTPVTSATVKRVKAKPGGDGERYSLHVLNADIADVLERLGRMAGRNVLIGRGVGGTVLSVNLDDVTLEETLEAIVRGRGLEYEEQGQFIHVMTADEHRARKRGRIDVDRTAALEAEAGRAPDREAQNQSESTESPTLKLPPLPPLESPAENR